MEVDSFGMKILMMLLILVMLMIKFIVLWLLMRFIFIDSYSNSNYNYDPCYPNLDRQVHGNNLPSRLVLVLVQMEL